VGAWTETSAEIGARRCLTERARREICRRVGEDKDTVAEVAAAFGVGWATAMGAVVDHGAPMVDAVDRVGPVEALGLDDVSFARGRIDRRARWSTVAVNLRTGQLIDVFEGRDTVAVRGWLDRQGPRWCQGVQALSIDQHEGYRSAALRPGPHTRVARLGHAQVIADRFHLVSLLNDRVTRGRLRVQHDTVGRRGQTGDALYDIRRKLLIGYERLTPVALEATHTGLAAGDPDGGVRELWSIKEQLRATLAITNPTVARLAFATLVERCRHSNMPEARSLVRTLVSWRDEILAGNTTGISNARCEATNLNIEELVRRARGFTNFRNYRLRILLALGVHWQTHHTARIRTRPRLIA
jgi:transposase